MDLSKLQRRTSSGRYIPEVDGIRFIAIMLVLFFHAVMVRSDGNYWHIAKPFGAGFGAAQWWDFGRYGVHLFFVLSGFILGLPFVVGQVNLKRYFKRRLTRLEPPYMVALMVWFLVSGVALKHFLLSAVYAHNLTGWNPINEPLWSLEVEIQFYIVLPLLACVFLIRRKALRRVLLVLAIGASVPGFLYLGTLALPRFLCFFLVGLLLADLYADHPIRIPLLRNRIVTTIGGMAYSIYLMHWPVMVLLGRHLRPVAAEIPALMLVAIVIGFGFYLLVERPCMDPDWPTRLRARVRGQAADRTVALSAAASNR
jgi:peptidoglycan/LPS O-acetylase OafA/YrhL